MKKSICGLISVSVLLILYLTLLPSVFGFESIVIQRNGEIEGTDLIVRSGDVYTFSENVSGTILILRDNLVLDGAGYALSGYGVLSYHGIDVTDQVNITVKNVIIEHFQYGLWLKNSSENTILDCTVTNNREWGLRLYNTSNSNNIVSNNFINNHFGGVQVFNESNNNLFSNNEFNMNAKGLEIATSQDNTIANNYIHGNDDGVVISDRRNIITENVITENFDRGIFLSGSKEGVVTSNTIESNGIGLISTSGSNNTINYNNFVKNYLQAKCIASNNTWINNFWSNYNGTGSEPYVIDVSNQDEFPLLEAISIPEFSLLGLLGLLALLTILLSILKKIGKFGNLNI